MHLASNMNAPQRNYKAKQELLAKTSNNLEDELQAILPLLSVMEKTGNSNSDYGLHHQTLNFPKSNNKNEKSHSYIGSLVIGMSYDRDGKIRHEKRQCCVRSDEHMSFLLAIKLSMSARHEKPPKGLNFEKFRVNVVVGARTLAHNDNFRGTTPSFAMILDDPSPSKEPSFGLKIWLYPEFHTSVMILNGKFIIPHNYDEGTDRFSCIQANEINYTCSYHVYPCRYIGSVEPYGKCDSEFVVCGVKQGKLQIVPNEYYKQYNEYTEINSPKNLPLCPFSKALEIASQNRQYSWPRVQYRTLYKTCHWHKMFAWPNIHEILCSQESMCSSTKSEKFAQALVLQLREAMCKFIRKVIAIN